WSHGLPSTPLNSDKRDVLVTFPAAWCLDCCTTTSLDRADKRLSYLRFSTVAGPVEAVEALMFRRVRFSRRTRKLPRHNHFIDGTMLLNCHQHVTGRS